jgi:hypothetical protein
MSMLQVDCVGSKEIYWKNRDNPKIKTVTSTDQDAAIDIVVRAFGTDPAARSLYPDSKQCSVNFANFVKAFGGKAFENDSAYTTDHYAGASPPICPMLRKPRPQ